MKYLGQRGIKMTRDEMIDQIVKDVGLNYDYKDFAADCVREVVTNWDEGELNDWFGIENEDE